jgi:hypothetical protein
VQIPVVALRWRNVLLALAACEECITRAAMITITAIGLFFAQVLPSVASEGVRAWLLFNVAALRADQEKGYDLG